MTDKPQRQPGMAWPPTAEPMSWPPPGQKARTVSNLAIAGVVLGLLMPIVGIVVAIVLLVRGEVGPGLAAVLASFVGFLGAILFLA